MDTLCIFLDQLDLWPVRRRLQLRFDFGSTAIPPRYDHSTLRSTSSGL